MPFQDEVRKMMMRIAKLLLLAAIALLYILVVFNNLTDFETNAQFVRHVLLMDTTIPGNHGMWRSISSPTVDLVFYLSIIAWEGLTAILLCWGALRLMRALRLPTAAFNSAKFLPLLALTSSLLMWLVAFLTVGGEWFLMWQSRSWNGQEEAFRNFAVVGIVFLILLQPDAEGQP
jgi:predicted small integral membrane protein